ARPARQPRPARASPAPAGPELAVRAPAAAAGAYAAPRSGPGCRADHRPARDGDPSDLGDLRSGPLAVPVRFADRDADRAADPGVIAGRAGYPSARCPGNVGGGAGHRSMTSGASV